MKRIIFLIVLLVAIPINASAETIVWQDSFESGWDEWSTDNGVWQIGVPTAGPGGCIEGSACAGTVLDGNYSANTDSRLISFHVVLPTVTGSEELHLRFQNWFSYSTADSGQVQMQVWNGSNWGSWVDGDWVADAWEDEGIPVVNTSGWSLKDVDLTAYAGETVRIAFYHTAADDGLSYTNDVSTGWYIDDVRIVAKVPEFSGDFETGWDDWSADRGVWQVGIPTAGPTSCYEGAQCAGTELNANYGHHTDSRLISVSMVLPTVTGLEELHLRFQNWFSYSTADSGQVQVQVWNGSNWGSWVDGDWVVDAWEDEGIPVVNTSGWSLKDVDLTAYAGETVRIAFYHTAADDGLSYTNDVSTGWYIDDVRIVAKVPEFSGDFETGWDDWSADRGVWQVGIPTAGPTSCYEGAQCAGTELNANYGHHTDSRLISASMVLPIVTGLEELHLRFQNWFSYSTADSGQVQVQVWNGSSWGAWVNGVWEDLAWVNEGIPVINTSGWSLKDVNLTAYAGETVRIAFYHTAADDGLSYTNDVSTGWYIDDVRIVAKVPEFSGDFETGWDDWSTDRGVWQVGIPTAGPTSCYEGEQCAGTELNGNYGHHTDSRLILATTTLCNGTGPEGVWLRFMTWFSYSTADYGQVQVQMWNGSSWGAWENIGTPINSTSGGWSLIHIDLTAYSGETVRIAFYHTAADDGLSYTNDVSTGWYIDDIQITGDDDNDGMCNWTDLCPGTPTGEVVDENGCSDCQNDSTLPECPDGDIDCDGVLNKVDKCFNPEYCGSGDFPPVDPTNGCPPLLQVQILDVDTTACPTIQTRLIVTDLDGNVITNLTETNFEVYVSDTLQAPITVQYEDQTTYPVAASLALDYSGSMGATAITDMENAAVEFINKLTDGDVGEIIKFANGIETAQSFTSSKADLIAAVNATTSLNPNATKFYDSVYQAITDTSLQGGRKAVIAMTDGRDNASVYSAEDVIIHAQSTGVPIFTIGLGKSVNPGALQSIANQTGGFYYETPDSSDLASIYQAISIVIKSQYLINFDSSYLDGLSHQLKIVAIDGSFFGSDEETFTVCLELDSDNDGLSDSDEIDIYNTSPDNSDTDNDGLDDGTEVAYWGANWNADPDGDQLVNLLDPDSDNDGLTDGVEVNILGTDPALTDADGNGIPDGDEDSDGDGFTNTEEAQCGSDPSDPNSKCNRGLPFLMLLLD